MLLPNSFKQAGFTIPSDARGKIRLKNGQILKPLLIGTEGMTDTGKTEFALSAPGVIQMIVVDRNYAGVFDNPHPPVTRNPNVFIKAVQVPMQGTVPLPQGYKPGMATDYTKYYGALRDSFYTALDNPESQVVVMDGDSDFWELHILAHFGKTTGIFPQTRYAAPYAEKRAQINRAFDSGKIVICTNKVKDEYETVYKEDGKTPEKDEMGNDLRRKTGDKERQGFKDQDYLFQIQLRHLYRPAGVQQMGKKLVEVSQSWGIRILKCKHDMSLIGTELWGDSCNFRGLVDLIYPDVPASRWGF